MPNRTSTSGSELFIVDNSDTDWKVLRYLHDWCQLSKSIDIATGYFEIGALLALKDEWQKVDHLRILMGDEVSRRTRNAFTAGLEKVKQRLDLSLEEEKEKNDFLRRNGNQLSQPFDGILIPKHPVQRVGFCPGRIVAHAECPHGKWTTRSIVVDNSRVTSPCHLCKVTATLQRSHILPAGLYRRMLDRGAKNPNPTMITPGRAVQTSEQATAYILCEECEKRFNEDGERWVLAHCFDGKGKFALRDLITQHVPLHSGAIVGTYSGRLAFGAHVEKLQYFAASIFWRASVHGRVGETGPRSVQLGSRYEEEFRKYLLGGTRFPDNSALVLSVSTAAKPYTAMNYPMVMARHPIGCHANRFVASGVYFDLLVGKQAVRAHPFCFVHSPENLVHLTARIDDWIEESCFKLSNRKAD